LSALFRVLAYEVSYSALMAFDGAAPVVAV
jgi:hypothetical protein